MGGSKDGEGGGGVLFFIDIILYLSNLGKFQGEIFNSTVFPNRTVLHNKQEIFKCTVPQQHSIA